MLAVLHQLVLGAANEVTRTGLDPADASELVVTTVLRAFAPKRVEA